MVYNSLFGKADKGRFFEYKRCKPSRHRLLNNPLNPNVTDIRKKCFKKPPEGDIK